MNFQQFEIIAGMLIDGMNASIAVTREVSNYTELDFATKVARFVLDDIRSIDASPEYVWSEQQCPGLAGALTKEESLPSEAILKLAAPAILSLSADSGEQVKNLAFQYCMKATIALLGESAG